MLVARPLKDGVGYFPKDTDFYEDDKVRLLRAEFSAKGMYALDYILCDLYGKNGYFIKWDKNKCFLVSDGAGCGCSPEFIAELIAGCVRCSFFDERVFNMFGILTSAGVQRRYMRMFNSRGEIRMIKEYWLLDIEDEKDVPAGILNKLIFKSLKTTENPVKCTENPDKSTVNTQSKIEESILKDIKANTTQSASDFSISEKNAEAMKLSFNELVSLAGQHPLRFTFAAVEARMQIINSGQTIEEYLEENGLTEVSH